MEPKSIEEIADTLEKLKVRVNGIEYKTGKKYFRKTMESVQREIRQEKWENLKEAFETILLMLLFLSMLGLMGAGVVHIYEWVVRML